MLTLLLTLNIRRKSKSASPIAPTAIAYGIALFIDAWYALGLPLPHIGVWVSNFSRPIAGMLYNLLK